MSGPDAARWAAELCADLTAKAQPGESVAPVEVQRSADLVIAVVGLVFSRIATAKTIRYYVTNVLRPLIRPLLTDDEYTGACAAAARSLHQLWVTNPTP